MWILLIKREPNSDTLSFEWDHVDFSFKLWLGVLGFTSADNSVIMWVPLPSVVIWVLVLNPDCWVDSLFIIHGVRSSFEDDLVDFMSL
jgi:hypothetical protein